MSVGQFVQQGAPVVAASSLPSRAGWCLPAGAAGRVLVRVSAMAVLAAAGSAYAAEEAALRTIAVQAANSQAAYIADGSVEAVRDSRVAAQVSGRITEVLVRAGDRVQAGQILMRIDPSAATQQVAGSQAQLAQADALLASARADYDRAKRLYAQDYLSAAALEHAQTQLKSAEAQARALGAQAAAAGVQAGYYTVRAPYAGWVAQVQVTVGDMAAPGVQLVSMYDPAALRVSAQIPESVVANLDQAVPAVVEVAGAPVQRGVRTTVLPALDTATHSATARVDLPPQAPSVLPGQFARVSFTLKDAGAALSARAGARVRVPRTAVVQRGELSAVYVVDAQGRAQLRQVRLGREAGEQIEVLAGLSGGERVALDPVAAARAGAR